MRTVRLFHRRPSEAEPLITALREAGYHVIYHPGTQAPSAREIQEAATLAVVIDLSRLPSHGRNVGAWLRGSKTTRQIPLIFVGGEPAKVAAIQKEIPDATYASHARLIGALKRVKPLKDPVIPKQMMQSDSQRTAAQKLGIREGMRVGLIDPPAGYARVIGTLPEGVVLRSTAAEKVREPWPADAVVRARSRRVRGVSPDAAHAGVDGSLVDRVAEGTLGRIEWKLRARGRAGGGNWWITRFARSMGCGVECFSR